MSDGRPKPSIPAWQRIPQTKPPATDDPVSSQPEPSNEAPTETPEESQSQEQSDDSESRATSDPPAVEDVRAKQSALGLSDFETFKQHEQQQPSRQEPPLQQARPTAPPIITYPEFLVEAHKSPPFITPTRVLNAVYAAGGAATLLYAASKWIISPMVENLSESRHDFLNHSQSKVDEVNERLSNIVSKTPESKQELHAPEVAADDADSETSDPTELFHRDMGTQTSPIISPSEISEAKKKDAVTYQTGALEIMKEHINELTEGSEKAAEANKDRQDTLNKLRHYLDGLMYSSAGISTWQTSEDAISMKNDKSGDDSIEELKKEIRGVKGVLLSAKRFPAVSRPVTGAA